MTGCNCIREADRWDCRGLPSSECAAIAEASGKVRRFRPGERERELEYLSGPTMAAKRRKANAAARKAQKGQT